MFVDQLDKPNGGANSLDTLDLQVEERDLDVVDGVENLIQSLRLRLLMPEGSLAGLGMPMFGSRLHELTGEPNNPRARLIAIAHARSALMRDPRVRKVVDLVVEQSAADTLRLSATVMTTELPEPVAVLLAVPVGSP